MRATRVIFYDSRRVKLKPCIVITFFHRVETSDGKTVQESGKLKNVGTDDEALEVRGQYSYTGDDGVVYQVTYTADEFGFHPQGAHIPQA